MSDKEKTTIRTGSKTQYSKGNGVNKGGTPPPPQKTKK